MDNLLIISEYLVGGLDPIFFPLLLLCPLAVGRLATLRAPDLSVVVRLDTVEPKALFCNDGMELRRKVLHHINGIERCSKSEHFFSKNFVEAIWVNFCPCCMVASVSLFSYERSVRCGSVVASSHVPLLHQPTSHPLQAQQQ